MTLFGVLAWVTLCWGLGEGSSLCCRVFSSEPGLYPLDVSSVPSLSTLTPTHTCARARAHTHTHAHAHTHTHTHTHTQQQQQQQPPKLSPDIVRCSTGSQGIKLSLLRTTTVGLEKAYRK